MKIFHARYDSYGATLHVQASSHYVARKLAAKRMGVPESHQCYIAIIDPEIAAKTPRTKSEAMLDYAARLGLTVHEMKMVQGAPADLIGYQLPTLRSVCSLK